MFDHSILRVHIRMLSQESRVQLLVLDYVKLLEFRHETYTYAINTECL